METQKKPCVNLCIKAQDGCANYYRVNSSTSMQKLLKEYCRTKQLEYKHVTFLHDGARFAVRRTVHELGIKDGDQIDAMMFQTGGGPSKCAMGES